MAEQMRVQRLRNAGHLPVALNNLMDTARPWVGGRLGHLNLLGEYDFSEDKLQDSVGIKPPKMTD